METARLIFQWLNLVGSAAIVVIAVGLAWRWEDARPVVAFPALWAVGGVVYYVAVLAGYLSADAVLVWGAAHRAMAVIMVAGFLLTLWAILAAPPLSDDDTDEPE